MELAKTIGIIIIILGIVTLLCIGCLRDSESPRMVSSGHDATDDGKYAVILAVLIIILGILLLI